MAVTYCEVTDVQGQIQSPVAYSGSTLPTSTQVEAWINEAEDEIDRITNNAWRAITITNEFYDFPTEYATGVGYGGGFFVGNGIPVHLRRRNISSLDKIEIWNGSEYEDWVATKTEGRDQDYWIDEEQGILYIRLYWPFYNKKAMRLSYKYGESSVPNDIKRAAVLMASINVIISDDRSSNLNETGDPTRVSYDERVSRWKADYKRILANRMELIVI